MTKIGLIVWAGFGAFSDDLIGYTQEQLLKQYIPDAQINDRLMHRRKTAGTAGFLNQFDLVVHGGGSLLGKCTHYPVNSIGNWHRKLKSPLAIFGPGYRYEPNLEPLKRSSRWRLKLLFRKAKVISVRGHRTVYHLRKNRIKVKKIHSLGDPVMACDIKLEKDPKYIMGNVRHSPQHEIKHVSNEVVQLGMAKIYDWLIDYYDQPLVLISFRNTKSDNDVLGAKFTRAKMKNKKRVTIRAPKDWRQAVGLMKDASFWFGQRLHPTVFAGINDIPFVGIEYQFEKMMDWASTVGINNFMYTNDLSLETFKKNFEEVPQNMKKLRRALPTRIKEINEVAQQIARLVS